MIFDFEVLSMPNFESWCIMIDHDKSTSNWERPGVRVNGNPTKCVHALVQPWTYYVRDPEPIGNMITWLFQSWTNDIRHGYEAASVTRSRSIWGQSFGFGFVVSKSQNFGFGFSFMNWQRLRLQFRLHIKPYKSKILHSNMDQWCANPNPDSDSYLDSEVFVLN